MVLVVPSQLDLEQSVGVGVVCDSFVGEETDESFLEGIEAALDFTFGGGVWSDAVGGAQSRKSSLELGMGIESVGWGAMAEEGEAVGIEAGGQATPFDGRAQMLEMSPSCITAHEGTGDNSAGMVVQREDKHWIMVCGPPSMGRTVVLPEFADRPSLPAAAGFGAAFLGGNLQGEMLANISGHCGPGTLEVMTPVQFVGQQGKIERLAVGQELLEKIMNGLGPGFLVVATGGSQLETGAVLEPLMAQLIEAGGTDHQPLGGGEGVECAGIKGGEDFLNVEGGGAVRELLLFIVASITAWGCCPQTP